jgi:hypothetical protein
MRENNPSHSPEAIECLARRGTRMLTDGSGCEFTHDPRLRGVREALSYFARTA